MKIRSPFPFPITKMRQPHTSTPRSSPSAPQRFRPSDPVQARRWRRPYVPPLFPESLAVSGPSRGGLTDALNPPLRTGRPNSSQRQTDLSPQLCVRKVTLRSQTDLPSASPGPKPGDLAKVLLPANLRAAQERARGVADKRRPRALRTELGDAGDQAPPVFGDVTSGATGPPLALREAPRTVFAEAGLRAVATVVGGEGRVRRRALSHGFLRLPARASPAPAWATGQGPRTHLGASWP